MFEKLAKYAAKQLELDASEITPDSTFESLGIDSLDVVEMIMDLESELGVDPQLQANSFNKQQRRALVELLKGFDLTITGKRPVAEAIITSGGIKVSEIEPKTMQSKKVPGLYFAGEIIDCDAYTGGFNLQIAWATAYAAGTAVGQG